MVKRLRHPMSMSSNDLKGSGEKSVSKSQGVTAATAAWLVYRPRQNGRHFADDTFIRIFMNENVRISINISLKFVPKGLINNIPALVQIMAWRRAGDKPLSEPMMVNLLTHIYVTRPQWVKKYLLIEHFGRVTISYESSWLALYIVPNA